MIITNDQMIFRETTYETNHDIYVIYLYCYTQSKDLTKHFYNVQYRTK